MSNDGFLMNGASRLALEEAVMVSSYRILVHPVVVFVKLN
jgi:hypothetical protein